MSGFGFVLGTPGGQQVTTESGLDIALEQGQQPQYFPTPPAPTAANLATPGGLAQNVELTLGVNGWNGDFVLTQTGDLALSIDTVSAANATQQRIVRLILTNPRLFDSSNNPIATPNDPFNPTWGAGIRALVGQMITPPLISGLQYRISSAILADPGVAASPPPVVSVLQISFYAVQVSVTCYSVSGETITIPSLSLPIGS